jgi:hypothetical protein
MQARFGVEGIEKHALFSRIALTGNADSACRRSHQSPPGAAQGDEK